MCQSKYMLYNATSYAGGQCEGSGCARACVCNFELEKVLATLAMTNWRVKRLVDLSQNGYSLLRPCIICITVFTNHQVIKCDDMAVKQGLFLDRATFLF